MPKCNGATHRLVSNEREWSDVSMPSANDNITTYAPRDSCKWVIEAPIGFAVRLRFTKFNVESPLARSPALVPQTGGDCPDYVEIYDGEDDARPGTPRIGRFCGNTPPEAQLGLTEFKTQGRYVVIRFSSDALNQWAGFTFEHRAVRVPGTPTGPQPDPNFQQRGRCNGQTFPIAATETVQILHSPNFDYGGYQSGDTCTWVIVAPKSNQKIQ